MQTRIDEEKKPKCFIAFFTTTILRVTTIFTTCVINAGPRNHQYKRVVEERTVKLQFSGLLTGVSTSKFTLG